MKERTHEIKNSIYDILLDINFEYDMYNFSVITYSESEFNCMKQNPLNLFYMSFSKDEVAI